MVGGAQSACITSVRVRFPGVRVNFLAATGHHLTKLLVRYMLVSRVAASLGARAAAAPHCGAKGVDTNPCPTLGAFALVPEPLAAFCADCAPASREIHFQTLTGSSHPRQSSGGGAHTPEPGSIVKINYIFEFDKTDGN